MHCQNSTSCCLFFSVFLTHNSYLAAVWLPESCNQCILLEAFGGMVQEKGSWERCSSWTVLHAQSTSALSSGFPLSQGNAEALERWVGKTKHHLISYFLSNTSAKNYRSRIVCVSNSKVGRLFRDTVYVMQTKLAITHRFAMLILKHVSFGKKVFLLNLHHMTHNSTITSSQQLTCSFLNKNASLSAYLHCILHSVATEAQPQFKSI